MRGPVQDRLAVAALGGLMVAAAGFWAPWVAHRAAALVIVGQDLGEFVKFLPEVRSGGLPIVRELLYAPPFCVCVVLALLAGNRLFRYLPVVRVVLLLAIFPISLALLPPVFALPVLRSEEFRLQVIGVVVCWAMVPLSFAFARLSIRLLCVCLAAAAAAGAALPLWQFARILPAIGRVYNAPIQIGWGPVATGLGFGVLIGLGVLRAIRDEGSKANADAAPLPAAPG